jgi:uncharacterized protein
MTAAKACLVAKASLVALLMCWAFVALAQVAVPPLTGRVVDQTGTLSSGDIEALTRKLKDFEARKGSQITVLIVPTTAPEEIEQYSIRVAEAWKIGRQKVDDGAILLVAKNDRKLRIEVGYGLEGALTDVTSRRIINEIITPKFKSGDFAGGISDGVDRIISVVDGEPLPAPQPQQSFEGGQDRFDILFNPLIIFGVFVAAAVLRTLLGRLIGSVATGGVVGVLAWLTVGSLVFSVVASVLAFAFALFAESVASTNGRSGRGGYSGGSYSGGGSSSSSDSGSFSGGGGSFGGGGASGSW